MAQQILLIDSDYVLRSIVKLNLMKAIGCDVVEKKSADDAISLLEILPTVDLIVCNEKIGTENTGELITNYLSTNKSSIPVLVVGNASSSFKHVVAIDSNQEWKKIILSAGEILGVKVDFDESKLQNEYAPISIDYFLNITSTSLGCDVFIRIKKGDDFQYIKRLHSTDEFSREDIEKYKKDGLKEFYVLKENFSSFVNYATSQLAMRLDNKDLSAGERVKLTSEAFNVTLERVQTLGVDEHTIGLVEESIKSMQTSLNDNNALASFLQSLRSNKLSYGYSHSYFCSIILHKVIGCFDWKSDQIKEKLTYIAFFHDISLREDLMKYYTEAEISDPSVSDEDEKLILNHAKLSAEIVEKFPSVPNGVGLILREHHGSKNGIGLPENLSIAISPLSMMFIVVENFVDEFLKIDRGLTAEDFDNIFKKLELKYNKVTYKQTLVALQDMLQSKKKPVK